MPERDGLAEYHAKRDPARTPEPQGATSPPAGRRFVVQRHEATRLHYDVRLEIDGVLVSWSVPKGPSLDPRVRRLAVRTEDHPLDYVDFEGVIPKGQYGGGTVIVWDTGEFDNADERSLGAGLAAGHLRFVVHGRKIAGRFSLIRTRPDGDQEMWLLLKKDDADADPQAHPVEHRPESVLSGRTNEDLRP